MVQLKAIVLLSGPIAVGKTSVRQELIANHSFAYVRSSAYLKALADAQGHDSQRANLQDLGDQLDIETDYLWLLNEVALPAFEASSGQKRWLVDSVRKERQIEQFRKAYGRRVLHVHLNASEIVLRRRYELRLVTTSDITPYRIAIQHGNEIASRSLVRIADLIFDTSTLTPQEIAAAIAHAMPE